MRYEVGRFRRPMRRSTEGQLVGLVDLGDGSTLALDFTAMSGLDSRFTFSRASTATFINSSGLVESAANGVARFDHDPDTLAPKGLLIEGSVTNLTAYSDGVNQSPWTVVCNVVRTTSTGGTAPDGTSNTASRIGMTGTITNCSALYYNGVTVTNQAYTHSVFVKADGADWVYVWIETSGGVANGAYFNLTGNGSVGNLVGSGTTARIEKFPNGWYRCQTTSTQPAGTTYPCVLPSTGDLTGRSSMVGTTPGNILVWGAQTEASSGASSYLPTGSGTVQRAADECTMTGANFSSWFNATGGTFLAHARRIRTTDVGRIASANDNTANESIDLGASTTGQFIVTDGGSALATITPGTVTANTAFKIAGAFELNNVQAALNGTLGTADTSVTMPTVTQLHIGRQGGASPVYLNGTVSLLKYWPTRLPDATLQSLTPTQ